MSNITSVELGATGRYIDLGTSPANNVNVGAQTIIAYCRPTASGGSGFGYLLGKVTPGSTRGLRFFVTHNNGAPYLSFGVDSSTGFGFPGRSGTPNEIAYNSWRHLEVTWDGGLDYSGIRLYIGGTESGYGAAANSSGSGTIESDAAKRLFLLNRGDVANLGREFVGDVAYIARWSRVLDSTERAAVRSNGPLSVPSGLILLWANQADQSTNAITPSGRSTFAAGTLPPNTNLGGGGTLNAAAAGTATASGTANASLDGPSTLNASASGGAVASGTAAADLTTPTIVSEPLYDNVTPPNLLANEPLVYAAVYHPTTGALVVRKTGLSTGADGRYTFTDPALSTGIDYLHDWLTASGHRRMPVKAAS